MVIVKEGELNMGTASINWSTVIVENSLNQQEWRETVRLLRSSKGLTEVSPGVGLLGSPVG